MRADKGRERVGLKIDERNRNMQILKVHAVLLSRRLSQVANSRSRDSDLFYASPSQRGDNREGGNRERAGGPARESNSDRGETKSPTRPRCAFYDRPRPSRRWWGQSLGSLFFARKFN